ncbi:hypothetical protein OC834_003317 [Tilletia horrida]|nr:hypothetical protein OC835_007360 [Tilletia horrida]KAK0530421.1 hypothetical protein OC834_003317 [Tilletia horrida]
MASQHQQYADNQSLGADFAQPGKRASLLAGLRTGGPRANSPAPTYGHDQYSQSQHMAQALADQAQLKATAAVFTPRTNSHGSPPISPEHELPSLQAHGHGISANERLTLMQQHHSQHQQIQNAQAQLAAIYGAGNGQGRAPEFNQYQDQQLLFHQQKNAQQNLQSQLAVQQQMQLEMIRLQAMQQQQAQQQQVQAQQRALLARIQAEYERQAQIAALTKRQEEMQEQLRMQQRHQEELAQQAALARMQHQQQQQQQQHGSAREQRQAAQASIQASLRSRRDEQLHVQQQQQQMLLQQLHRFNDGGFEQARLMSPPPTLPVNHAQQHGANALSQQQQVELEALMRQISLAHQEEERIQQQQEALAALTMQRTQTPPTSADTSAAREGEQTGNGGTNRRDRMSSHADASASWRSSLGAMAGVAALRKNSNTPPSIVIDDSDSDYSISRSSLDLRRGAGSGRSGLANVNNSAPDTPETSEEDLSSFPLHHKKKDGGQGHKVGAGASDVPAVLPSGQLNTKPTNVIRSSALAGLLGNMQRNRSDSAAGGVASLPARPVLALNGMHTGNGEGGRVPSPPTDSLLLGTGSQHPSNGANTPASSNGHQHQHHQAGSSNAPRRQPKGPPTEFLAHNFASRITLRTRREAMSKLCASPRASVLSFANTTLPRATAA